MSFIFVGGWAKRELDIVAFPNSDCPSCKSLGQPHLRVSYTYNHFYHVMCWLDNQRFFLYCDKCAYSEELDPNKAIAAYGEDPIPFIHRYGLLVSIVLLIASIIIFFSFNVK